MTNDLYPEKVTLEYIRELEKGDVAEIMHAAELREAFGYAPSLKIRNQEEDQAMPKSDEKPEPILMDTGGLTYRLAECDRLPGVYVLHLEASYPPQVVKLSGTAPGLADCLHNLLHAVREKLSPETELRELRDRVADLEKDQIVDDLLERLEDDYELPRKVSL